MHAMSAGGTDIRSHAAYKCGNVRFAKPEFVEGGVGDRKMCAEGGLSNSVEVGNDAATAMRAAFRALSG